MIHPYFYSEMCLAVIAAHRPTLLPMVLGPDRLAQLIAKTRDNFTSTIRAIRGLA